MSDQDTQYQNEIVAPVRRVIYKEALTKLAFAYSQALPDVIALLKDILFEIEGRKEKENKS